MRKAMTATLAAAAVALTACGGELDDGDPAAASTLTATTTSAEKSRYPSEPVPVACTPQENGLLMGVV